MDFLWVVAAYLLGAVPVSQIIARWRRPGADLRTVGTGTVSGTGLYRVAGLWALLLGGSLDVAKGAIAATLVPAESVWAVPVAAAVVVGHCWSVFLGGAGGRGISPALGALAVLAWPGAVVLLAGLAIGRMFRQTGLGVFIADLAVVVVLGVTGGSAGVAVGLAVVVPMLVKRVRGNHPPARTARTYAWRLLYDADPPAEGSAGIDFTGIDGATPATIIHLLAARLERHRDELNRLNVYPVPDGDTGDNLTDTLASVVRHVAAAGDRADISGVIAHGALIGGRGSSGVILGEALRGFVRTLADARDAVALAAALHAAAESARLAVADPVEGTMLTVARDAARAARAAAASPGTPAAVARAAAEEGRRCLARTPDLLPALAQAGVVDAGGLGYVLFLDAVAEAVAGEPGQPIRTAATTGGDNAPLTDEPGQRYEVVCLLETNPDRMEALRRRWLALGDTVAVAGGERTWRCHLHTGDVAGALDAAGEAGELLEVDVTDLAEQTAEHGPETGGSPHSGRGVR